MAGVPSTGSPELRSRASAHFTIHEEADDHQDTRVTATQEGSVGF